MAFASRAATIGLALIALMFSFSLHWSYFRGSPLRAESPLGPNLEFEHLFHHAGCKARDMVPQLSCSADNNLPTRLDELAWSPGDGHRWHAFAVQRIQTGEFDSRLGSAIEAMFQREPWARDLRMSHALLSLRAMNWVDGHVQALWASNLLAVTRYQKSEFLIDVAKHSQAFSACALIGEQIPFWCSRIDQWQIECTKPDKVPKWQRFCERSGIS